MNDEQLYRYFIFLCKIFKLTRKKIKLDLKPGREISGDLGRYYYPTKQNPHGERKILIASKRIHKKYNDCREASLLHELIHANLEKIDIGYEEDEFITERFATQLSDVLINQFKQYEQGRKNNKPRKDITQNK